MIRRVSSTTVRPTPSTVPARLSRAEAAWTTPSWAARVSVCSNSSALVSAIAAWVARVVMKATSPLVQSRGSYVIAASAPMTRSWWMSGAIRSPANATTAVVVLVAAAEIRADVGEGQHAAAAQDLADPALVAVEVGQVRRRRRSGRPAQAATSSWSSCRMRIVVASARSARRVSSTIVRNSSSRSCEAASRSAMPRTVSSRSASSSSSDADRARWSGPDADRRSPPSSRRNNDGAAP